MKKLLAIALTAILCLSLAACNSGTSDSPASAGDTAPAEPTAPADNDDASDNDQPAGSGDTAVGDASASSWPSGNVSLYLPATAGGGTDMIGRVFAQAMGDVAGKAFVVINDTTGGGTVASETIRNAKTDGLNLLLINTGMSAQIASGQYDHTYDEFTVLGLVTTPSKEATGIFVSGSSEFDTLEDLVNFGKENPGELISAVQAGGAGMFATILFNDEVGIDTTIVDAGPDADRITALIGGSVDVSVLNNVSARQYVESGDLKCLTLLAQHSDLIPDAPNMEDAGYNAVELPMVIMLMGPPDMDPNDVAKIAETLETVCADPEVQESFEKLGAEWIYTSPADSAAFLAKVQDDFNAAYAIMEEKGLA